MLHGAGGRHGETRENGVECCRRTCNSPCRTQRAYLHSLSPVPASLSDMLFWHDRRASERRLSKLDTQCQTRTRLLPGAAQCPECSRVFRSRPSCDHRGPVGEQRPVELQALHCHCDLADGARDAHFRDIHPSLGLVRIDEGAAQCTGRSRHSCHVRINWRIHVRGYTDRSVELALSSSPVAPALSAVQLEPSKQKLQ